MSIAFSHRSRYKARKRNEMGFMGLSICSGTQGSEVGVGTCETRWQSSWKARLSQHLDLKAES